MVSPAADRDAAGGSDQGGPIRVMVVDDSAVIRGLIARWLDERPEISVVATCANGVQALRRLEPSRAEVVVLDIEMPEMDGLTALPKMLEAQPTLRVLMASTLTRRNAEISLRALSLGAADYITKPTAVRSVTTSIDFRRDVVDKVVGLGRAARVERGVAPPRAKGADETRAARLVGPTGPYADRKTQGPLTLRAPGRVRPTVLAVGSSTGGPRALAELVREIGGKITAPILITQHMPPNFTAILAEHLSRESSAVAQEGRDGEPITSGRIYVAPGDFHMVVKDSGGSPSISLNQNPPENFCRPAVDPMFRSIRDVYGSRVLCVVLTGMGADGREGARGVVEAGGTVLAQDEKSSVVWGMPGAVAVAGLCSAVAPIPELARHVISMVNEGRL